MSIQTMLAISNGNDGLFHSLSVVREEKVCLVNWTQGHKSTSDHHNMRRILKRRQDSGHRVTSHLITYLNLHEPFPVGASRLLSSTLM